MQKQTSNYIKLTTSTLLVLLLATQISSWSKCPSGRCLSCNHKGCVKCYDWWPNYDYTCSLPGVNNSAINCLHQHPTLEKKCLRCRQGFYVNNASECTSIGSTDCIDGIWLDGKFRCTSCKNGKSASYNGDCTETIPGNMTGHCTASNMTYTSAGVTYVCAQCDHGYALDHDNNCKVSCAEGCLKCDANHVCIECDHYRNWWSTSPHNCTNPTFDYYNPKYGSSVMVRILAGVGLFAALQFGL